MQGVGGLWYMYYTLQSRYRIKASMKTKLSIFYFLILLIAGIYLVQHAHAQNGISINDAISRIETLKEKANRDIEVYESEVQKCNDTISKSEDILRLAREASNLKAESIAHDAILKAQKARQKNIELKNSAEVLRKKAEQVLSYAKNNNAEAASVLEQFEFEHAKSQWIKNQRHIIEQRIKEPSPYVNDIYKSLKTKAPPGLPDRKYEDLKPGDVILISPDDANSFWINIGDRIASVSKSPASHTVVYLKEVNGNKLFLDNTPGRGLHVIGEDEFLKSYGKRDALTASVAQPLTEEESKKLWDAAKEAIMQESITQEKKSGNIIDQTGYGLFGNDNMVCSETSRWALIRAGRNIPDTTSNLKKSIGIDFSPANFYMDNYNFIITPLWAPKE